MLLSRMPFQAAIDEPHGSNGLTPGILGAFGAFGAPAPFPSSGRCPLMVSSFQSRGSGVVRRVGGSPRRLLDRSAAPDSRLPTIPAASSVPPRAARSAALGGLG